MVDCGTPDLLASSVCVFRCLVHPIAVINAPGGRPASPSPGRLKLLHPEVEQAPVGAEG